MASPTAIRFGALLADNYGQLVRFVALLEREQELLLDVQVEALLDMTEQKTAAVRQLQNGENARAMMLAADGVESSAQGIENFMAEQGEALQAAWSKYREIARKASELNELNGKLIRQQLQNNQQALTILLAAGGHTLYGSDGQAAVRPTGRLFGSA